MVYVPVLPKDPNSFDMNDAMALLNQRINESRVRLAGGFPEAFGKPLLQIDPNVQMHTGGPGIARPTSRLETETFNTVSGQFIGNAGPFRFELSKVGEEGYGIDLVTHATGGRSGQGVDAFLSMARHLAQQGKKLYVGVTEQSPAAKQITNKLKESGFLGSDENGKFVVTGE